MVFASSETCYLLEEYLSDEKKYSLARNHEITQERDGLYHIARL